MILNHRFDIRSVAIHCLRKVFPRAVWMGLIYSTARSSKTRCGSTGSMFQPSTTGKDRACVLVFQDGTRAINPDGVLHVPQVLDNLIAKKEIPVTVGIFITPGQRGDEFPDSIGTGNPNNRDREYDVLDDAYARFVIDEMLPEVGKRYNLATDPASRASVAQAAAPFVPSPSPGSAPINSAM